VTAEIENGSYCSAELKAAVEIIWLAEITIINNFFIEPSQPDARSIRPIYVIHGANST
jgi:hypothetical protein